MIFHTSSEFVPYLFEDSPKLAAHILLGLIVFGASSFYLYFKRSSADKGYRLTIFIGILSFGIYAILCGYITAVFAVYPSWLAYKYWGQATA